MNVMRDCGGGLIFCWAAEMCRRCFHAFLLPWWTSRRTALGVCGVGISRTHVHHGIEDGAALLVGEPLFPWRVFRFRVRLSASVCVHCSIGCVCPQPQEHDLQKVAQDVQGSGRRTQGAPRLPHSACPLTHLLPSPKPHSHSPTHPHYTTPHTAHSTPPPPQCSPRSCRASAKTRPSPFLRRTRTCRRVVASPSCPFRW